MGVANFFLDPPLNPETVDGGEGEEEAEDGGEVMGWKRVGGNVDGEE